MKTGGKSVDRILLLLTLLLVGSGFFIFSSAALGLLARGSVPVASVATSHLVLGMGLGMLALIIVSRINYRVWKGWAPYLFALSLIATALVFVPGLGFGSGGAIRWIHLGPVSFQPGEALKIGTALFAAYYYTTYRNKAQDLLWGMGGFLAIIALPAILLLLQPDTGTFGVVLVAGASVFFAAGARWRDIFIAIVIGILLLGFLAFTRPYVKERIDTFLHPEHDLQGKSYQVNQSLIAIGSGGIWGRGFGQSIQKFEYLPEPVNDSIFAVAGEEFGFWGATTIVFLFFAFVARALWLAGRVPDVFGALLMVGIASYFGAQAFLNIGSMLGLFPLTGIPLVFISQGGTALFIALGATGILLNISRFART